MDEAKMAAIREMTQGVVADQERRTQDASRASRGSTRGGYSPEASDDPRVAEAYGRGGKFEAGDPERTTFSQGTRRLGRNTS